MDTRLTFSCAARSACLLCTAERRPEHSRFVLHWCRYRYTVFKEDSTSASDVLANHMDVEIKPPAVATVNWGGSTQATFEIVDQTGADLPDGRYTVSKAGWEDLTRTRNRQGV